MSSKNIAVAGGTGNIGRAIVEELVAHGGYNIFILARGQNNEKAKELVPPVLTVDYSNQSTLVSVLESNGIDTVISTLSSMVGADPELALIQAAKASSVTRRFIPSVWGVRYTPEVAKVYPNAHAKLRAFAALSSSGLEYTVVLNGFFLDYFGIPHIKTYLPSFPFVLDIANNVASIPASGDVPIAFTYSFDVGRFVGRLLGESKWDKESIIIGDQLTWKEFLAIAEDAKGAKFDVSYDSLEMLRKGQITELPGHKELYSFFPKESLQGISASFAILMEEGYVTLERKGSLNDRYEDLKVKTAKDLVGEAWKGRK